MKVGLLADIHGNADALCVVLDAATAAGAGRLLVAGDLIGYYYEPGRVMDSLADWQTDIVRGNHEDMLEAWQSAGDDAPVRSEILAGYGSGLAVADHRLGDDEKRLLRSLPRTRRLKIDSAVVLLCHGTPGDTDAYLYPDAPDADWESEIPGGVDLIVHGHTHYPVVRRVGGCAIVNPGSVGQPRDRKPGACWALWDTETGEIALRRETYDTSDLVAECAVRDPDVPYLAEVLTRT